MKLPRIRFLWSEAEKTGKFSGTNYVRALKVTTESGVRLFIGIDGRVFVRACIGLFLALWLGSVFGLSLWLDRNPYNRIGAVDLLLPWRWSSLRDLRAQSHIAQGREDLKARRLGDGIFRIKAGLRQLPGDAVARLEVAQVYAGFGQWELARDMLLPAFETGVPPRAYMRFFFEQAQRFEDQALMLDVAGRLLARPDLSDTDRRWLIERKLDALFALGRFDEVLTVTADPQLAYVWRVQELRVAALCRLHRGQDAIAYIESITWSAAREGARMQLLAAAYREAGRLDDMSALLTRIAETNALDPEAWLFSLSLSWTAGRKDEARDFLQRYLRRFEIKDEHVRMAALRAAALPAPPLVQLCVTSARERGRPLPELLWQLALAQLRNGDFAPFGQTAAQLVAASKQALPAAEWLELMVAAVRTDVPEAEEPLVRWFRVQRRSPQIYRDTLIGLEKAGRWSTMAAVANVAVGAFPTSTELRERNELAVTKKAEQAAPAAKAAAAAASTPARTPATAAAINPATPSTPRPSAPAPHFASAALFWRELDPQIAEKDWARADATIASVRRADPAWLRDAAAELDWRETRVAFGLNDALRVRRLVTRRLDRDKFDVTRALEFAREYQAAGNLTAARALTDDILARVPESGPARRFLAEITPPPPEKKAP